MAKFRIEHLLTKLNLKMREFVNAEIDQINSENNDFRINNIEDDAWIEGSLDEKVLNYDQCGFSYIADIQTIVNGHAIVQSVSIEYDLIISERADFLDYKRILRYQDALLYAAASAWGKAGNGYDKATIISLNPVDVKLFNSSHFHKVIGIQFNFDLLNS